MAVRHSQVQSLVEGLQAAGLQIERPELAPLAALRALPPREALLVLAEPDSLSVVVSLMGLPVVVHTLTPAPGPEGVPEAAVVALEEVLRQYAARSPQAPLDPLPPLYLAGSQADNLRLADRLGRALGMAPRTAASPTRRSRRPAYGLLPGQPGPGLALTVIGPGGPPPGPGKRRLPRQLERRFW